LWSVKLVYFYWLLKLFFVGGFWWGWGGGLGSWLG
jgi:hypothetical protein